MSIILTHSLLLFLLIIIITPLHALTHISVSVNGNAVGHSVIPLTEENFHDITSTGNHLIKFYAPWCTHCKTLEPIYQQAASLLSPETLQLSDLDCTLFSKLCKLQGIDGYPTLKFKRHNITTDYKYGRTVKEILEFSQRIHQPPIQYLQTYSDTLTLLKQNPSSNIFVLYEDQKESSISKLFVNIASTYVGTSTLRFIQLPLSTIPHSVSSHDNIHKPIIGVLKYRGGNDDTSTGNTEQHVDTLDTTTVSNELIQTDELIKFIETHKFPLIHEINADTYNDIIYNNGIDAKRQKFVVLIFIDPSYSDTVNQEYINTLYPIAEKTMKYMIFSTVDLQRYAAYASTYGIHRNISDVKQNYPRTVVYEYPEMYFIPIHHPSNHTLQQIYQQRSLTADELHEYLAQIIRGTIRSYSVLPWHSPRRYINTFLWYFNELTAMMKFALSGAILVTVLGLLYLFFNSIGFLDDPQASSVKSSRGVADLQRQHQQKEETNSKSKALNDVLNDTDGSSDNAPLRQRK